MTNFKEMLRCSGKKCCAVVTSVPEYIEQVTPEVVTRWVATDSPVIFRLQRVDFVAAGQSQDGSTLEVALEEAYTGAEGNAIKVFSQHDGQMYSGLVTSIDGVNVITDIPWNSDFDIQYLNDYTLHPGYYIETVLTINGVVNPIPIISFPNTLGWADVDISKVLRLATKGGKVGDYTSLVQKETNKSGSFTMKFKEVWYGSAEAYTEEGNTWYYAQAVRNAEEGSNLHEFVDNEITEGKFFNAFEKPVYFVGKPFDISFILPVHDAPAEITVTIKVYDSTHALLDTITEVVTDTTLQGYLNSLTIPEITQATASYMTVEIA